MDRARIPGKAEEGIRSQQLTSCRCSGRVVSTLNSFGQRITDVARLITLVIYGNITDPATVTV